MRAVLNQLDILRLANLVDVTVKQQTGMRATEATTALIELKKKLRQLEDDDQQLIPPTDLLFSFAGFLTTQDEWITQYGDPHPGSLLDLLNRFVHQHGYNENVSTFYDEAVTAGQRLHERDDAQNADGYQDQQAEGQDRGSTVADSSAEIATGGAEGGEPGTEGGERSDVTGEHGKRW